MSSPLYSCPNCGANLSLDQLRGTDCPYCRSAFPHHARAVEHAALVNQVMAQNMAAFAMSTPIVPVIPGVPVLVIGSGHRGLHPALHPALHQGLHQGLHAGAHADAIRRVNNAIATTVFVAIAMAVALTLACAAMLG
jgi:hypothetical protein